MRTAFYLSFFASAYIIFYSIKPDLWGVPRYQAELWIPFVILGFYNVVVILRNMEISQKYFSYAFATLISFNTIAITHLNLISRHVDQQKNYYSEVKTGDVKIWSESVYSIRDALQTVRKKGYTKNTCVVGITYGSFSEVMNGYSFEEMQSVWTNATFCSMWGPLNFSTVNDNMNIKLVLFVDKPLKETEINLFLDSGQWVVWDKFYNEKYGSTIVGIVRK